MNTLHLSIKRDRFNPKQTLGLLYIDGAFECYTCEDTVREVVGKPVSAWKIPKVTAIPTGTYKVVVNWSEHFKKMLPEVLGVPGFEGVRIHSGNTEADTEGCILLGDIRFPTYIGASRLAATRIQKKIQVALDRGDEVTLTIQ